MYLWKLKPFLLTLCFSSIDFVSKKKETFPLKVQRLILGREYESKHTSHWQILP